MLAITNLGLLQFTYKPLIMANRPIPVSEANRMIETYISYMTKLGVDMSKQTASISFTEPALSTWMAEVRPYADEFRICEGVYPPDHEAAGRITVIIWPYKDGKPATRPAEEEGVGGGPSTPIPPYNEGGRIP
jgi:hypothetical protein